MVTQRTTNSSVDGERSISSRVCYDHKGNVVHQGHRYFPPGDPCNQCTCDNGEPDRCSSVFCQPPSCKDPRLLPDKCCHFICLNSNISDPSDHRIIPQLPSSHGLGLRLIASTITSFLILALLLFMMHRLRQRRLLLMIRRLQNRRLEHNLSANDSGCFPVYDQTDFGLRGAFLDPPPPYAFWKPPETYIPSGEAPPPYEESVFNGVTITADETSNTRNNERSTTTTGTSPIRNHVHVPFTEAPSSDHPQVNLAVCNHVSVANGFESSSSSCSTINLSHSAVPSPSNTSSDSSFPREEECRAKCYHEK